MTKREFVRLTVEHGHEREEIARQPFTTELCEMISVQRNDCTKFGPMTPLEVAVALGVGDHLYVRADRIYGYRLIDQDSPI